MSARLEMIRPRRRVTTVTHNLFFESVKIPGSGFAYECTPSGTILDPLKWGGRVRELVRDPAYKEPVVQESHGSHIEHAIGRCQCGEDVHLPDPLDNQCAGCGRWYNMVGQPVLSPYSSAGRVARMEDDGLWGAGA